MTPNIISIYQILILPAKSKQNKRKKIHLTTKSNNSYLLISLDHATAYSHTLILNYSVTNRFWLFVNPSRQGGEFLPLPLIQYNTTKTRRSFGIHYIRLCAATVARVYALRVISPLPLSSLLIRSDALLTNSSPPLLLERTPPPPRFLGRVAANGTEKFRETSSFLRKLCGGTSLRFIGRLVE